MAETKTFNPSEHLISLKGKDYLEVKYRLVWFREENPKGTIIPELVERGDGWALFKATVTKEDGGMAVAHAQETKTDFAEFLEKAETKAVGRALGMLGYGTQFAPDLDFEEPGKDKVVDAPANSSKAASSPAQRTVHKATGEVADPKGVESYYNEYEKKMYHKGECSHCGKTVPAKSVSFTNYKYGRSLCYDCQQLAEDGTLADPKENIQAQDIMEVYGEA